MEWLQKAGDLLDKLDKTAAEKLNANDEDAEDEEALLRLLESSDAADILNESPGEGESKGEGEEGKKEAKDGKALSPRSSLRADISRLETSLRKKSSQVEQLVTSHKSLMNATAERERKANAETAKLRTQVDEAQKGQRAAEAKRTEAEKQLEAMRKHLESQSGEGEQLRAEAATARSEASSAQAQSAGLKLELEEEQQAHAELLARHATMMEQLTSARAEHRTELGSLQDREESLSSEKLYFTRELAAVERKRQESETSAREAESLLRQAEERTKEAEGALQTAEEEAANLGRKIGLLEMAGGKLEERIQGVRDEAEAETKVVRRELEAAQMTVRQLQREQRQALSRGGEQELQMQLSKMCEEVLAKQALLEQVMGEKAALRARLENEGNRIEDLTIQLARAHPALCPALGRMEEGMSRGGPHDAIADELSIASRAFSDAVKARDASGAMRAGDSIFAISASAVASDSTVRMLAGVYLLVLQTSGFIAVMHALLGKHHH